MTAGLPGTGIGSLFYVLLTVWMPFRELPALLRGRSSWKRWRFIAWQWAMLGAILVSLWYFTEFLTWCYVQSADWLSGGRYAVQTTTKTVAFAAAWGGFFTLSFVLATVFVLRAVVRRAALRKGRGAIRSASLPAAGLARSLAPAAPLREPVSLAPAK